MLYIYKTKFASESEYRQLVDPQPEQLENGNPNPEWLQSVESVVVIGTIIKRATYDEDGNELTPEQVIEGYHVDFLSPVLIPELVPYCLDHEPESPVHGYGWAGSDYVLVTKNS